MATSRRRRVHFGDFVADLASGELARSGAKVRLQEKPFRILSVLVQHPHEVVSRQEIIHTVWPGTYVQGDLCLNVAVRRLRAALHDDAAKPRFIETVGSHGYRFIGNVHRGLASDMPPSARKRPRIALFPLRALAATHAECFAESMTEVTIVELRRMHPFFSLIAPEFMTAREEAEHNASSLCRKVAAEYMMVGTVSESEGQIRVVVRLLRCCSQTCVWAESYTEPKSEFFARQQAIGQKIASAVAQAVPVQLCPSDVYDIPAQSHRKFLKACMLLSQLTEDSLVECSGLLEQVVHECPRFALAWAALGDVYCLTARLGLAQSSEMFPEVRQCAAKALEIEDLAEGRTLLAYYHLFYDHEWTTAEAAFLAALAIDAKYPPALGGYTQLLSAMGRHNEAVALLRDACDADPAVSYTKTMLGWAMYYAGDYDGALDQLQKAAQLDSSLWFTHSSAGMALEQLGRISEAIDEFRLAMELSKNSILARANLAFGLARAGERAEATAMLRTILKQRKRHYFSPYWIAAIYLALNNTAEALDWLEAAARERCGWFIFAREDPKFASLRGNVRFRRAVLGINLAHALISPA